MAIAEGISFLVLLFIAMPLKYGFDIPQAVRTVGLLHGVLFLAYIIMLYMVWTAENWKLQKVALAFVASLLPFGTLWFDKKLR